MPANAGIQILALDPREFIPDLIGDGDERREMSLTPLLDASLVIQVHAFAAMSAFSLGIVQFAAPKGTLPHRTIGWIWVALMAIIAVSSFWIQNIRLVGPFSPIHLTSIYILVILPFAVLAARGHKVSRHRKLMTGLFVVGLVIAGAITFWPGRIMHAVAFGN